MVAECSSFLEMALGWAIRADEESNVKPRTLRQMRGKGCATRRSRFGNQIASYDACVLAATEKKLWRKPVTAEVTY